MAFASSGTTTQTKTGPVSFPSLNLLKHGLEEKKTVEFKVTHETAKLNNKNIYLIKFDSEIDAIKPCIFSVAIDVSGSMDGSSSDDPKSEGAKFSRLDLVKHSLKTIVHSLRPCDQLSITKFSEKGECIFELTKMTELGKQIALKRINEIHSEGRTNLWDGLVKMLNKTESFVDDDINIFNVLLTDGEPNLNPLRGITVEYFDLIKKNPLKSSVHTFGYGYSLNSSLLKTIAESSGGSFSHISDHTMCNTVFINYISDCFARATNKIMIEPKVPVQCYNRKIINGKIDCGSLQSGVTKYVTFSTPDNSLSLLINGIDYKFELKESTYELMTNDSGNIALNNDFAYQMFKHNLFSIINDGLHDTDSKNVLKNIDGLCELLKHAISTTDDDMLKTKYVNLLKNLKNNDPNDGQVEKAFYKKEWLTKWGIHYLKYFISSHLNHSCTNFKDSSLEEYAGPLFTKVRSEVESVFDLIPVPTPSLSSKPYTGDFKYTFYNASGSCFDGFSKTTLFDGKKIFVKDVKKGDKLINSDGNVMNVVCVLKTKVPDNKVIMNNINGMLITPYHPVRFNGIWNFPCDFSKPENVNCDYMYDFVVDNHHVVTINGVDVITLGHGFKGNPITEHHFFGTDKVINKLKENKGWENGLVEVNKYKPVYFGSGDNISIETFEIE